MNFQELQTTFYDMFSESSTNARFNTTKVKYWLNEGYRIILSEIKKNDNDKQVIRKNVYTLCSDAGTSTGTTLYVDSVSGMQKAQYLIVSDGTTFERVQISSISGTTVTLISPGLVGSYTDGDFVSSNQVWLPGNFNEIYSVICEELTTTVHAGQVLNQTTQIRNEIINPIINSKAMPTSYYIDGADLFYGTITAESGTNITAFASSGLSAHEDNYYTDWLFINQTRNAWARVTSSTISPKLINLDTTITGQTTGDVGALRRQLYSLFFDTMPDKQYNFIISYNASSSNMVNAYDVPILEERHHQVIVDYALWRASISARDYESANMHYASYNQGLKRIKDQYYYPSNGTLSFRNYLDVYEDAPITRYGR